MADRVVIVRSASQLVSLSFEQIDEILGADRMESIQDLPEGAVPDNSTDPYWVNSGGEWFPVNTLLPGTSVSAGSQIVIVRSGDVSRAFAVDQVLGIETPGEMAMLPERTRRYTEIPIEGVRFWKDNLVLELDLSRMISLDLGS